MGRILMKCRKEMLAARQRASELETFRLTRREALRLSIELRRMQLSPPTPWRKVAPEERWLAYEAYKAMQFTQLRLFGIPVEVI